VYIGASLVCSIFPDVRRICEGVLWMFYQMDPSTSVRTLKNFVKSFTTVQHGKVVERNVPKESPDRFKVDIDCLKRKGAGQKDGEPRLIEIRGAGGGSRSYGRRLLT
jgi:hypothetical protein